MGFQLEKRFELARTYLLDREKTISEIAYMLGYSSIQHFSKAFRKKYGVAPGKLRKA
ncbi:helix-turn-helix domain-containing protein [Chitinophaga sp. 212800010-3]|uniref:helix-turn-helix domain-containing protein n=1 Tax=unclassified Chitinophaga TaxID=2619133 RepID=UPI002DEED881|nr:Helix-turn-helix transcriptional regulator [Chitinophaga sp. 212800010-3]